MSYAVVLDPSAAISGRTELDLDSGDIQVDRAGVEWGDAAIKAYLAEQQYGEGAVSFRVPNRIISIPLLLGAQVLATQEDEITAEEAARRALNEKVALLQRQGGVVLRQRDGGEPLYADVVNATLMIPDVLGSTGGVEPGTVLKLECLPDFYGEEIELDVQEGDGNIAALLQQEGVDAVIKGDYPARTRIVLRDLAAADQKGVLWGLRSTHYDAAPTAALFYDARDMTPINGAEAQEATAPSTYSGDWLILQEPQPDIWHPFMTTDLVAGGDQLTHVGSYRIWARCFSYGEAQRLRLAWSLDDATAPTYNAAVAVADAGHKSGEISIKDPVLVDLGEIRIGRPPVGKHWWRGILQVNTGATPNEIAVDRIWLQPVDDGAGRLRATAVPSSDILAPSKTPTEATSLKEGGTTDWINPSGALNVGEFARFPFVLGGGTNKLQLLNPGFAIPEGVTIRGIKVVCASTSADTPVVVLTKGEERRIRENFTQGGPADLWGWPWTPVEINSAAFGVLFRAPGSPEEIVVGGPVVIRVYYSYSAGGITEDAILYSERAAEVRFDGAYRQDTTTDAYTRVSEETGDLPRLPPSGLEARPCELFVKNSRGTLNGAPDPDIDKFRAQIQYRPCYIGRI